MVKVQKALENAVSELRAIGIENAVYEAGLIIEKHTGLKRYDIRFKDFILNQKQLFDIQADIDRRKRKEPLQYILGTWEFMSLEFQVRPGVLIPRADTEILAETVLELIKRNNFFDCADLCTGSGCIGISVCHYNKNVSVQAYDISDDALTVSRENAKINETSRFHVHKLNVLADTSGSYDIIFSNPPYIETSVIETLDSEVKDFEPRLALDGGADGLAFYKTVIPLWKKALRSGGYMCFECGIGQADSICNLFFENGYLDIKTYKDLNKIERVIVAKLL